ncbi:MAG TPA: PLP-dependent aminotransferase family protein [Stellaceae bacterium]|jgi:DNA-binding transcriptional MocR family regulator|nr:PLP-dependent aminotransferase family protein [Stellaceae bacterium]
MMTNWQPLLTREKAPLYREIADALAGDIATGALPAGSRLPTHRDLAWRLKVTVGTVSRAYSEAERRGLIGGEIGRGTFVLPTHGDWPAPAAAADQDGLVDLSVNYAITGCEERLLADGIGDLSRRRDLSRFLHYQPHAGTDEDRTAGAEWLRRTGLHDAKADRTIVTNGGQHGIAVLVSALTRPGDAIAVEQLSYPGLKAVAHQSGIHLVGVVTDEAGLRPDALDAACRARTLRGLYIMPTLHNPTTITMPLERRREIAAVCREHDLAVIEDDVYGFLFAQPLPALVTLLPERGFYISSTSKAFAPGLRLGYIHVPPRDIERVTGALRASTYMAPPLMAAIASRWIGDGSADRMAAEKRQLAAARYPIVTGILGADGLGTTLMADPASLHCWLSLPPQWRAEEFAASAQRAGVGVTPAAAFAVGPAAATPEAIRLCLGTTATPLLEQALRTLADLLAATPGPYLSVV